MPGPQRVQVLHQHVTAAAPALSFKRLFIANRGEIACRIHRAAKKLGLETVGIYTEEDAGGLHPKVLDKMIKLPPGATSVAPYIDAVSVSEIAAREGCGAVHPGYGFLAENDEFAALCEKKGVRFVGPTPETIDLFGDKTKAKECAANAKLPILQSSPGMTNVEDAKQFLKQNPMAFPLLLKASFGGGGRGQMVVENPNQFADAFSKCSKEAEMSFGRSEVFIERFLPKARHIEVQVIGDGKKCIHYFERDCSVQLRKQKVIEIAPSRGMHEALRERICGAAARMCESVGYRGAGTVEFLVEGELSDPAAMFYFLELNPRIQVEHTITEEITGTDLVALQLRIASGETLASMGIQQPTSFSGAAIQIRVGLAPGGGGVVTGYSEPAGVRVDSSVAQGTTAVTDYDPMIAKVIIHGSNFADALEKSRAALAAYKVEGVKLNKEFLERIMAHETFVKGGVHTTWVEDQKLHMAPIKKSTGGAGTIMEIKAPFPGQVLEVKVKPGDEVAADDVLLIISAMKMLNDVAVDRPAKVLEVCIEPNVQVNDGDLLVRLEATGDAPVDEDAAPPSQSVRRSPGGGQIGSGTGDSVTSTWYVNGVPEEESIDTPVLRTKFKPGDAVYQKRLEHNLGLSKELERRLSIVKGGGPKKSKDLHFSRGKDLVRDRIAKISDKGTTFMELSALAGWEMYGGGVHSGGFITGIGLVCGRECMFYGTDATIKGGVTHPVGYKKWLRAQDIAMENRLPCIYIIDGGGAKLDSVMESTKDKKTGRDLSYEGMLPAFFVEGGKQFYNQARMSGMGIAQISVICGMCTAGGAYTPAMSDETIIVQGNGTVYLGGPPLVKAATGEDCDEQSLGGGVMHTTKSGTCDHLAPDEETALRMCREVVENLGTRVPRTVLNRQQPEPPLYDPETMLGVVPESTNIPYDIREVIARIVDGSRFHEFKARYGPTMICGWAHIEGYPVGILANNGMLFSEAALKATHFIQTCGKRGTPLVFLHNITGFIIGTTYEQGGITKDGAKMINAVSNVPVPKFAVVCGGSFGAGNYAMCGPGFNPRFTFVWPGARLSVMGGEQAAGVVAIVKQAALKRDGQQEMPEEMVNMLKKPIIDAIESRNSAWHSSAGVFDDGIIDPRDTRRVLAQAISVSLNAPLPEYNYGVFRM